MNPKYFNRPFKLGVNDCWTLVREIYMDEHGIDLPKLPIATNLNQDDVYDAFHNNIKLEKVQVAERGCIIVFRSGRMKWHCGYALNSKQHFHQTREKVGVEAIPENADIYKVLHV